MRPASASPFRSPGFLQFWVAGTVSEFGTYITTIALQVLVVITLGGTAADVGLVNAARWLPYLLVGLVVGALVDRYRRKPVLITTDLSRGLLLGTIPLLWVVHALSVPVLMAFVFVFGLLSLIFDAASQSFLPRLVDRSLLVVAHSRIDQSSTVAQTSGPLVAGGLVSLLGAPIAVLLDAITYVLSAIALIRIRVREPVPTPEKRHLRREIGEGLRWVYRHETIAPLALSTHGWFLFNSMLTTAFVPFALLSLGLTPFELGFALAAAGVGGFAGSLASIPLGLRFGAGPTVIATRLAMPLGWALVALAPAVEPLVVLVIAQLFIGFTMGVENPNEMGYQQAITPDHLQARMNATKRSINRAAIVVGAPVGGLLAVAIGYRPVFWIAGAGLVVVALLLAVSPFRRARHPD